ncbi:hypothetical protein BLA29_012266 [Euroglyphus maynei]|uniref:acid phosphatase n=1 Tax=Euroglyphus maynei TaxID=6958 RepID=A0A1Y3AWX9_EURMA|nr:hypothetical protein BLA29_012266 [Euroglyphus maynei]
MFGEIFQQLNVHFGNDSSQSKNNLHQIYIYSTHDEWLAQFLSAMKVYNNIPPSFGATVMLEVYQHSPNDEPYFKGFYLNATETQHAYPLQFPDCTEPCTLSKFHQSIKDLIIEDPEKLLKHECYIDIKKCL